uniref:Uncharacterized protein n=1 Tax=Spodoptera frugiperda ascovirus 1a TaxID=113370 RepID=Q9DKL6_SFAVA|nr:hypothetical protein [Spodoptera frugiperda ascovirus 1a]
MRSRAAVARSSRSARPPVAVDIFSGPMSVAKSMKSCVVRAEMLPHSNLWCRIRKHTYTCRYTIETYRIWWYSSRGQHTEQYQQSDYRQRDVGRRR